MIKNLFTFLFFLLLFGFQIHGINTRYIVIFLECVLLCIVPSGLYYLRKTLLDKFVFYITVIFLFFNFILPLIPSILHFTFDTSLIIETIGVTVSFIGVILTLALCRAYNIDLEGLKQITFNVFVIQSVIILACFMSPAFHELIKQFQFQNIVEISERYLNSGVIRGLALAGDLYFGLTSVFGLFFLFLFYQFKVTYKLSYYVICLLSFAASLFIGRSCILGIALGIVYILMTREGITGKAIFSKFAIIFFTLLVVVMAIMPGDFYLLCTEIVFPYAFEIFYNVAEGDGLSSASTDDLGDMLSVGMSLKSFLLGDGWFLNKDASYYMHVDVGYYRMLFYGGVFYCIAYLVASIYLLWGSFFIRQQCKSSLSFRNFTLVLFIYMCVMNVKGLYFFFSRESMILVTFFILGSHLCYKNDFLLGYKTSECEAS